MDELQGQPGPDAPVPAGRGPIRAAVGRRAVLAGFAAVVLGGAGAAALGLRAGDEDRSETSATGQSGTAASGQPVTEFARGERGAPVQLSGRTLTDEPLDVEDLRGAVLVINVWGSWCAPCRVEAPILARISDEFADRGVAFVGINVKDNRAAAVAFEERYGITYPSIEDRDGGAVLALSSYVPASAVPVTLVLDREGRVAARVLGAVREATLRTLLDTVLAEAA